MIKRFKAGKPIPPYIYHCHCELSRLLFIECGTTA